MQLYSWSHFQMNSFSALNNQIEAIINYILSKGYSIASLEDHLRE